MTHPQRITSRAVLADLAVLAYRAIVSLAQLHKTPGTHRHQTEIDPLRSTRYHFGALWDSPATDPTPGVTWHQVPTPLRAACLLCGEQIKFGDRGEVVHSRPTHIECFIASTVGCHLGLCWGDCHGEPFQGTFREYALAVTGLLNKQRARDGCEPL